MRRCRFVSAVSKAGSISPFVRIRLRKSISFSDKIYMALLLPKKYVRSNIFTTMVQICQKYRFCPKEKAIFTIGSANVVVSRPGIEGLKNELTRNFDICKRLYIVLIYNRL